MPIQRTLAFVALSLVCAAAGGCDLGSNQSADGAKAGFRGAPLKPMPGFPRYQRLAGIEVPGAVVNLAGGNLLLPRVDLSIDTRLGTREVTATYSSASRKWHWSFEMSFDGAQLVDPMGASFEQFWRRGVPIQAGDWIWHDAMHIRSAGGLLHEFDADGRLSVIHWMSDPYPRLEYLAETIAGAARTTQVRQCRAPGVCEGVYDVEYDAAGNVTALVDRAGRRAEFVWNAEGLLIQARDALDLARGWPGFRYEYEDGRIHAQTNSEGERILYLTLPAGQVIRVDQRGVGRHRFQHGRWDYASGPDTPDRHVTHIGPDQRRTVYHFDGHHRLRKRTGHDGLVTTWAWNGYEVSRLERPDGSVTEWERIDDDEILQRDPGGNEVRTRFVSDGGENRAQPGRRAVEQVEDALGLIERRHYESHRLLWLENGAGERTTFEYDAENQISRVTNPSGVATRLEDHGEHGHPTRVVFASETEIRTYDAVGNLLQRDGPALHDFRPGGQVARVYDENRNLAELVIADAPTSGPAAQASILFERRSDGRPLRITRPQGGDHEFVYDAAGRLAERRERVDGVWQATLFAHDVRNRVRSVTLPNGMRRETDYDLLGRLSAVRALRNGATEHEAAFAYEDGRLRTLTDLAASSPETYTWDAAGRLATIAFADGEQLELAWDARGRRTTETYRLPGGSVLRTLGFGYDTAGRAVRLDDDGETVLDRSFTDGRVESTTYGNALIRRFSYDPQSGLPSASLLEHPVQGVLAATRIDLVAAPLPDGAELTLETTSGPDTTVEQYRLGPFGAGGPRVVSWSDGAALLPCAYDLLGNLVDSETGGHTFNAEGNRLLEIAEPGGGPVAVDYASDLAGYVTTRSGESLSWTAHGYIASVGGRAEFEWDAVGRPLRRRIEAEERRFLFGGRVETDPAGTPLRIDLDAVVLELATGERRYRHPDLRGNIKLVTDDTAQVVAHYTYGPYGIDDRLGTDDESATFARGRAIGDLVVLGPRLLDPTAGRFLAPDPIFQQVSQFAYAAGNPVWWWDPAGLAGAAIDPVQEVRIEMGAAVKRMAIGVASMLGGAAIAIGRPDVGVGIIVAGGVYTADASIDYSTASKKLALLTKPPPRTGPSATHQPFPQPWSSGPMAPLPGNIPSSIPFPHNTSCQACTTTRSQPGHGGGRTPFFGAGSWSRGIGW